MAPQIRPMPFGAKVSKLYAGKFYLPPAKYNMFLYCLEQGHILNNQEAIAYVEEFGSWLD